MSSDPKHSVADCLRFDWRGGSRVGGDKASSTGDRADIALAHDRVAKASKVEQR